ncbi:MAG: permease, partial [Syntrophobacterales bacterium]|nr:permease [Syntrophobacterales bacterium]
RKDDAARTSGQIYVPDADDRQRTLLQDSLYLLTMVLILVFASFSRPATGATGFWPVVFAYKWYITAALLGILAFMVKAWFTKNECVNWVNSTWGFMKQIFPLLIGGLLVAGFLLGRPGHPALIPEHYVQSLLGGNSLWANLFASVAGALMYFATLTEIPILQGLIGSGMGKGPALALLLAGPALSLPNMLVIGSVMGIKKTVTFCGIIIIMSTIAGLIYGSFAG